jgi:hypothetical protein
MVKSETENVIQAKILGLTMVMAPSSGGFAGRSDWERGGPILYIACSVGLVSSLGTLPWCFEPASTRAVLVGGGVGPLSGVHGGRRAGPDPARVLLISPIFLRNLGHRLGILNSLLKLVVVTR